MICASLSFRAGGAGSQPELQLDETVPEWMRKVNVSLNPTESAIFKQMSNSADYQVSSSCNFQLAVGTFNR